MSEKLALKDAPLVCVLLGVLIGLIAITILRGWRLDVIDRDELRPISGLLQRVHTTNLPKAGPKLHLYLIDSRQRRHHLTQDDLTCDYPAVRALSPGDSVRALVKGDLLGCDLEWVWAPEHGSQVLFTYDDVLRFKIRRAQRARPLAYTVGAGSGIFVAVGLLRYCFGAWRGAV